MTTAAELRSAAEDAIESWNSCYREPGTIESETVRMARHILATVHADDDEPVTEEWCDARPEMWVPTQGGAYRLRRFRHVVIYNGELHIGNDCTTARTIGQVMAVVRALGIEPRK